MSLFKKMFYVIRDIGVRVHLCQMIQDGSTRNRIATELGVNQICIRNVWRLSHDTQNYLGRHGSGQEFLQIGELILKFCSINEFFF